MAVDEALLRSCESGNQEFPVVRFYWWKNPTLSIGAKERLGEAADLNACSELGVSLVRRPSGGRAVLHDHELTYSIVARLGNHPFDKSVERSYRLISEAMRDGLRTFGVELELTSGSSRIRPRTSNRTNASNGDRNINSRHSPCFATVSRHELTFDGRKVVGSAQRRLRNAVLQHGSVLLRSDVDTLSRATGTDRERSKVLTAAMIGIEDILQREVDRRGLIEAITPALSGVLRYELVPGDLTDEESRLAAELIHEVSAGLNRNG
jgi:lipoate-protein ligase A